MMGERKKDANFATEIISDMKRRRNIWRIIAAAGVALNIIQWLF